MCVGTNELKSSKRTSQISRSVIDFTLFLKSETNAATISLIVPRKDSLNNKAQEVNSRLMQHVQWTRHNFYWPHWHIDTERHLNESKVHLNKSGTIEFVKNVCEFLLQQDWYSANNSGNTALGSEKSSIVSGVNNPIPEHSHVISQPDSFRNSGNKSVRGNQIWKNQMKFHQILREELSLNPIKLWKIYVVETSIGWSLHNLI